MQKRKFLTACGVKARIKGRIFSNLANQIKIDFVYLLVALLLLCTMGSGFAQINSAADGKQNIGLPDTNVIIRITYPALTDREGKNLQLPVPPHHHPRLYFSADDRAVLKEKFNSPLLQTCRNRIELASARLTDGYLQKGNKKNNSTEVRDALEAKALMYVLDRDNKTGRHAVDGLLHYFATLKINMAAADVTREIGRAITTGAMVYDWCYELLGAEEKTILIGRMETLAAQMEIEWPQIKGSSITSHTAEAQLARDMLSFAIAVYDEKPIIYNRVVGRIFSEFVPARQFFYPAGFHHQGSAYGAYRFYWDMYSSFIFGKMGYPDLYGKEQSKIPYYFIYSRRPDGQLMRDGDDYNEQFAAFGKWWGPGQNALLFAGSLHKDPIVLNEALKERKPGETADYIFDFLFFDIRAVNTAASKATLPLTRYLGSPSGTMIARTGWQDGIQSADVIAVMKVQEYNFSNHQHLDAGNFQLYYKGPLTVQSGIYQGTNGSYGSEHFKNYSQRSIAHNTVLVYDSAEKFTWHGREIINDGGQPFPNGAHEPLNMQELLTQGYKTGTVLAHAFGPDSITPDFSYLKGELSDAYSKKIKSFERSFVFLNLHNTQVPAAMIVFDRVEAADKKFKKTWLLHCVQEPVIAGHKTTIRRTEKGYQGRLVNTTLLPGPGNLNINKVGGPGNEFRVQEKNFPQSIIAPDNSGDSAVWRIEVTPGAAALSDHFLNVMQVMDDDNGRSKPLAVEKAMTDKLAGASIGDRLVLFSKNGKLLDENFTLDISTAGMLKVLITGVGAGYWNVLCTDNKKRSPGIMESKDQLLYFMADKGNYIIQKQVPK